MCPPVSAAHSRVLTVADLSAADSQQSCGIPNMLDPSSAADAVATDACIDTAAANAAEPLKIAERPQCHITIVFASTTCRQCQRRYAILDGREPDLDMDLPVSLVSVISKVQ